MLTIKYYSWKARWVFQMCKETNIRSCPQYISFIQKICCWYPIKIAPFLVHENIFNSISDIFYNPFGSCKIITVNSCCCFIVIINSVSLSIVRHFTNMFSNIVSSCPAITESVNFILLVVPSQYNDLPGFNRQLMNKIIPMGKYIIRQSNTYRFASLSYRNLYIDLRNRSGFYIIGSQNARF